MGMFDSLYVPCPECGCKVEFQSKAGQCSLDHYTLDDCPLVVLADVATQPIGVCSGCGMGVSVHVYYHAMVLRKRVR